MDMVPEVGWCLERGYDDVQQVHPRVLEQISHDNE